MHKSFDQGTHQYLVNAFVNNGFGDIGLHILGQHQKEQLIGVGKHSKIIDFLIFDKMLKFANLHNELVQMCQVYYY